MSMKIYMYLNKIKNNKFTLIFTDLETKQNNPKSYDNC